MRQGKRRKWVKMISSLLFCAFLTEFLLCGCGQCESTKIISLPENKKEEENAGIVIKDIQKYVHDGHTEDTLWMSWGEPGSDIAFMLILKEEGYMYQKIDVKTEQILDEIFVEDRFISNVCIAPGGRYISYEVEDESELILFFPEEDKKLVLWHWEERPIACSYTWSADGTKLFSWQNGDNYEETSDEDWSVICYSVQEAKAGDNTESRVVKNEIGMKDKGYAWRSVLPNADGSEVYVRVEYETFSDSKNAEDRSAPMAVSKEKISAENWLLSPETHEKKRLPEYYKEAVYPVKYTKAGLYFQNVGGDLFLVENIEETSFVTELFNTERMEIYVCENGDHIFLAEWRDNMEVLQLSGVRIVDGKPTASQVLYKEAYQNASTSINANDTAVIIEGDEYLGEDRYSFKITKLEY